MQIVIPSAGRLLTALALSMLVLGASVPAAAAPGPVRLGFMNDASSSVGIAWSTYSGAVGASVKYGTQKGQYTKTVTGKSSQISSTLGTVSEVTLSGLSPSTTYYYQVGGSSGGWSPEYHFKTGPKPHPQCGKVNFVVFGDSRAESWQGSKGASDMWVTLIKKAAATQPMFFLHGGDIVHDGKEQKQWYNHVAKSNVVSPYFPMAYAIGNHDDGPGSGDVANYNRLYNFPRSSKAHGGSGTEDYYYFIVGNAIVLVLSTESYSTGSPKFKDQAAWADKVLTLYPKRWRFAILHRPVYTEKGLFGHAPNEAGHNAAFAPVFTKHHVDMVFQSHNHFYERWVPSNCTTGSTKVCSTTVDKGTIYITTGGGGAFPIILPGFTNSKRLKASGEHHYLNISISDHTLKLQTLNPNAKVIDSLTITKQLSGPDPCLVPPPPPDMGPPDAGMPDAKVPNPDLPLQADKGKPQVDQGKPQVDQGKPQVDKGKPQVDKGKPQVDKGKPQVDKGKPQVDGKPAKADQAKPGKDSSAPKADADAKLDNVDAGCSCNLQSQDPEAAWLLLVLGALLLLRRRA